MTTGNQLSTDGTYNYTYDANGNELTKTNISTGDYWTYGYDDKNEMTSAVDKTSGGTIETSRHLLVMMPWQPDQGTRASTTGTLTTTCSPWTAGTRRWRGAAATATERLGRLERSNT